MYQYILFDLDGTLTDPKLGITGCVQYALMQNVSGKKADVAMAGDRKFDVAPNFAGLRSRPRGQLIFV